MYVLIGHQLREFDTAYDRIKKFYGRDYIAVEKSSQKRITLRCSYIYSCFLINNWI